MAYYLGRKEGEDEKPKENIANKIDSLIALGINSIDSLKSFSELVTSSIVLINSTRWFLSPSIDPNTTWTQIQVQQLSQDISRGLINNPDDVVRGFEGIAQSSKPGIVNSTTLANWVDGAKTFVPALGNITSFGLSLGGMITGNKDMQAAGDTSGGVLNILQGTQIWGNQAVIVESTSTILGRVTTPAIGTLGLFQYGSSSARLINDQNINPIASGEWDNTAWIERIGVMTTGIGGIFLAAGTATALFGGPCGIAVAAVLFPAGAVFTGAGAIMQNWGWVTSTANDVYTTVQNWSQNLADVPANPNEVQAIPKPTPSVSSSPSATLSAPTEIQPPTASTTQEAPTPSSSTPTHTPQP